MKEIKFPSHTVKTKWTSIKNTVIDNILKSLDEATREIFLSTLSSYIFKLSYFSFNVILQLKNESHLFHKINITTSFNTLEQY